MDRDAWVGGGAGEDTATRTRLAVSGYRSTRSRAVASDTQRKRAARSAVRSQSGTKPTIVRRACHSGFVQAVRSCTTETKGGPLDAMGPTVDGVLDVFRTEGDKWSFARVDEQNRVLETAEKRRISPWATTGLYYFRRGRDFVKHASDMIAANERSNNEFYVAPVYNRLIAAGADIRANPLERVWVLGTPEDLDNFEREYPRSARA